MEFEIIAEFFVNNSVDLIEDHDYIFQLELQLRIMNDKQDKRPESSRPRNITNNVNFLVEI
jgi:hypothetical protein